MHYMALALSLGRRGLGTTWPNPAVGCVIVRDGRIVGRGWTAPGGRPHAETQALARAGVLAQGATAYVSLEPCAHHGETPPCAQALIDAGIARVVAALPDTDPRVSGRGFAMLRAAGIAVTSGVCAIEAAKDHAGFFSRVETGRPWVTLKLASTMDGRIATATGESQWITGPEARREVHAQRMRHDAVMVGAGTARADNPSLTVRDMGAQRQPVRIVISRRLDLPLMGQLARTAKDIPLWICHGPNPDPMLARTWLDLGAKLIECPTRRGQIDPSQALKLLGSEGLTRIFCEGGGALAASLLTDDLVAEVIGFTGPLVMGAEGLPAVGALGLQRLAQAPRFTLQEVRQVGADCLQRWQRSPT